MTNTKRYLSNCYVYLLQTCDEGVSKSYVGWTVDLDKRLAAHNDGSGAKATRGRQWKLVHSEVFTTRGAAMAREYHLKKDRAERQKLLNGL
jgi:putative endonuclease